MSDPKPSYLAMEFLDPSPHSTLKYQESLPIRLTIGDGEEQRIVYVHETLLTTVSEYFKIALNSNFSEGQQKSCIFPEDDPCAFRAFVQYLYTGKYEVNIVWPSTEGGEQQSWFHLHAQCFALGNKLVAPSFKKYVVCQLAAVLERTLKSDLSPMMGTILLMAKTVYDGTLPKDGWEMRDLLATYCASRLGSNEDHNDNGQSTGWNLTEIKMFAKSQLEEFIGDVTCKVRPCSKFNAVEFAGLHFEPSVDSLMKSKTTTSPRGCRWYYQEGLGSVE